MLEQYYQELHNFITRTLGCRQRAADVAQEAYVRVLGHAAAHAPQTPSRALLYQTAKHILIDQHRHARHRQHEDIATLDAAAPPASQPEQQLEQRQRLDAAMQCIAHLGISRNMAEQHIISGTITGATSLRVTSYNCLPMPSRRWNSLLPHIRISATDSFYQMRRTLAIAPPNRCRTSLPRR